MLLHLSNSLIMSSDPCAQSSRPILFSRAVVSSKLFSASSKHCCKSKKVLGLILHTGGKLCFKVHFKNKEARIMERICWFTAFRWYKSLTFQIMGFDNVNLQPHSFLHMLNRIDFIVAYPIPLWPLFFFSFPLWCYNQGWSQSRHCSFSYHWLK